MFWPRTVGARPPAAGPWLARLLWTIWHWWGSPSWWLDNVTVWILHWSSVWKLLFGKYCTEIWHDLEGRSITWFLFLHGVCLKLNWGVGFIASHITSHHNHHYCRLIFGIGQQTGEPENRTQNSENLNLNVELVCLIWANVTINNLSVKINCYFREKNYPCTDHNNCSNQNLLCAGWMRLSASHSTFQPRVSSV